MRASSLSLREVTSVPLSTYSPRVGTSRQPSTFIMVDLPEPDAPTMATNSPRSIWRDTPSSARTSLSWPSL